MDHRRTTDSIVPSRLEADERFVRPGAENLNHVLQRLEGHYVRGYGDRSGDASIRLLPGAAEAARHFLSEEKKAEERLATVADLIDGFETPYGLELLATVHWVAVDKSDSTLEAAIEGVHAWSERKRDAFPTNHITKAWERLRHHELLP